MIQIQDNSRNNNDDLSVQAPVSNPVNQNPVTTNAANLNQAAPVSSKATVSVPAANPIQGLVGDVKASNDQIKNEIPANPVESKNVDVESQASEDEINDLLAQLEKLSQEIENKAETGAKTEANLGNKQEEVLEKESVDVEVESEFDMDKFLRDLEQKIAEDSDNNNEDEPAFRKNRVADRGGVELDNDDESNTDQTVPMTMKTKAAPSANKQDLVREVDELLDEAMKMEVSKESIAEISQKKQTPKLKEQDLVGEVDELLDEAMNLSNSDKSDGQQMNEIADVEADTSTDSSMLEEKEELPQSLESQSVFEMLNIDDINAEEREEFLTELENLIWDDFVKTDLPLMLTSDEYQGAEEILNSQKDEDQKKEDLLVYVEKILPDIEEIMYEKAIGLKEEMFMERIRKMEEAAVGDQDVLNAIEQVKKLIQVGQWKTAVETLNQA